MKLKRPIFPLKLLSSMLLAATCLFPLTTAVGYAQNLPTLGDTEREDLSPLLERKLGEQIMQSIRTDPDYLDDAPVEEFLNKMGNRLLAAKPEARGETSYDFEFFALRDPVLNAFALPGGFIALHSALILAAQNESELASVMGHEIGHVAQRHIARMIGSQRQDSLIPIAAMILAALAARSSPDAAMALAAGGQGLAIQRQLNFSRDAEREADRVGFQILRDAGYDTSGMVAFFGRLDASMRNYNDTAPAYLRSHPLTTERIADIQARQVGLRYKQHLDSLEFFLMRSRVRVLQDPSPQGLLDAGVFFENQIKNENEMGKIAGQYGLAFVAYKQRHFDHSQHLLDEVIKQVQDSPSMKNTLKESNAFVDLSIAIKLANDQPDLAVKEAQAAMETLPLSRGVARQYADALLAAKRPEDAAHFLRDQIQLYRSETRLYNMLAKVYSAQGKQALEHMTLAEEYGLKDQLPAALQQLDIARRSPDAQYYDLAVIDAREREWKEKHKQEMEDEKHHK